MSGPGRPIRPGLCSVTLARRTPREVVECCARAGLEGIEWWGRDHAPPGDMARAREVAALCADAGIACASYGSYYRVGAADPGADFDAVLATADALGAPAVRVWAGEADWEEHGRGEVQSIAEEALRLADIAQRAGLRLVFEFHTGSLTNRAENAERFAALVPHPAIGFSWQPQHGYRRAFNEMGLRLLLPRLASVHVFHWTIGAWEDSIVNETIRPIAHPDDFHIHPLADGAGNWAAYLSIAASAGGSRWAFLEFVRGDEPAQVEADAATLRQLLAGIA